MTLTSNLSERELQRPESSQTHVCTFVDLTNANLAGALVTGRNFAETTSRGFTKEQLYSTASYQQKNLQGIGLGYNDLSGWDFSGQNLTNADFSIALISPRISPTPT